MGERADRIFSTFTYTLTESASNYGNVMSKFDQYFVPKRNIIYERSLFHTRKQSDTETVEQYFSQLHELIRKCE